MFEGLSGGDSRSTRPGEPVFGGLLRAVIVPFAVLAGAGFVASVAVHLASWTPVVLPTWVMGLHVGIFVVWLPAVLVSRPLVADYPQRDFLRASLRGAPRWMYRAVQFTMVYAIVNFVIFIATGVRGGEASTRGFSGHWMLFYGAAAAILYSALHAVDERRICPNGHVASREAHFCERCGAALPSAPGGRAG